PPDRLHHLDAGGLLPPARRGVLVLRDPLPAGGWAARVFLRHQATRLLVRAARQLVRAAQTVSGGAALPGRAGADAGPRPGAGRGARRTRSARRGAAVLAIRPAARAGTLPGALPPRALSRGAGASRRRDSAAGKRVEAGQALVGIRGLAAADRRSRAKRR